MKSTSIFFNSLVANIFVIMLVVVSSCAGEDFFPGGTTVEGVSYRFDNSTKEATATGYVVVNGKLLTNISLPDQLTSANLAYKVTAIGDLAFAGASACESVEIGANVRTIGEMAFSGCTAIKVIKIEGSIAPLLPEDAFEQKVYDSATLILPRGCDITSSNWLKFTNIVEL